MDSALVSPYSSAMSSRYSSREPSPIPVQHVQLNPYRLPRFWRGFVVGGLAIPGSYGLYRLGSYVWNRFQNKFNKSSVGYPALPTSTPKPTPKPKYSRHR